MIIGGLNLNIDKNEMEIICPGYEEWINILERYEGTNIKTANKLLDELLGKQEKQYLVQLLFAKDGWYRRINGRGMYLLKLAAINLGFTNNVFSYDANVEKQILDQLKTISKDEQILLMGCYLKQKLVSYITLKNYLNHKSQTTITLYRGIKSSWTGKDYMSVGLESWTTDLNVAYKFATESGYVIEKNFPIEQIFISQCSCFKNRGETKNKNGFFVRIEKEYIVENIENRYEIKQEQIHTWTDREVV